MADKISTERRSANMAKIRSVSTKPELVVRRTAHALGYRFRLHRKDLPGKPDLVFASKRKVIFVHGCFWHQHSDCREGRLPGTNQEYWGPKLARNTERDAKRLKELTTQGWSSLVIWECEITNAKSIADRIKRFLR